MMFPEEQRKVFPYFNGKEKVFGDPLRIWRRLNYYLDGDPNKALAESRSPIPVIAFEAKERILEAIRLSFDMPFDPITGEGATEDECDEALRVYSEWVSKKKMIPATMPTSLPPTVS